MPEDGRTFISNFECTGITIGKFTIKRGSNMSDVKSSKSKNENSNLHKNRNYKFKINQLNVQNKTSFLLSFMNLPNPSLRVGCDKRSIFKRTMYFPTPPYELCATRGQFLNGVSRVIIQ